MIIDDLSTKTLQHHQDTIVHTQSEERATFRCAFHKNARQVRTVTRKQADHMIDER